jgi:hypothetical protein
MGTSNDADTTPELLTSLLISTCKEAELALSKQPRMRAMVKGKWLDSSGSTAILSIITALYVAIANVGDSRAVLAQLPKSDSAGGAGGAGGAGVGGAGGAGGAGEQVEQVGQVGFEFSSSSSGVLEAVGLSRDHKATIPEERQRAEEAGAT